MTQYKSWRIIDGKPRWVIVDENRNIINKNPTEEKLKNTQTEIPIGKNVKYTDDGLLEDLRQFYKKNGRVPVQIDFPNNHAYYIRFGSWNRSLYMAGLWEKRYNDTHTCNRCGGNFDEITGLKYPSKEYDKERNFIGWVCSNCYQKYDPNSGNNIKKSISNCRNYSQNPHSNTAKGDKFEELTCRWMCVKNLNKDNDNYSTGTPVDHSADHEGKIFQTKGRFYNSRNGLWNFSNLEEEWNKKFDYMICYCASKDGKTIERVYKIPKSKIINIKGVSIVENSSRGIGWYERYRITDNNTIKKINKIWQEILVAYS